MQPETARSLFGYADGKPSACPEQERATNEQDALTRVGDASADCSSSLDEYIEDCGTEKTLCPSQHTVTFHDVNTGLFHLFRVACKRWTCDYCGSCKRAKLQAEIKAARPNRFLTLTTCGGANETPRQIFDWTRRQLSELTKQYRREGRPIEYLRVLEATKLGFPHYHLLVRSEYLEQKELSHRWAHLTRAFIVDIRSLTRDENAARYVMKYLTKQGSVPFTNRRLSWTRNFFPKTPPKPKSELCPIGVQRHKMTLEQLEYYEFPNATFEKVNKWHWIQRPNVSPDVGRDDSF